MRIIDILLAIPSILLAISIVTALGPELRNVMIAGAILSAAGLGFIGLAIVVTIFALKPKFIVQDEPYG